MGRIIVIIVIIAVAAILAFYLFIYPAREDFGGEKRSDKDSNLEDFVIMGDLVLKSSAFKHKADIPSKYSCDEEDINPALMIENVPENTKSLVLIMDDPDATGGGIWDHWVMWNISPTTKEISENSVPESAVQGKSSWGTQKYGGPCPPKGNSKHRYMFKLYALDVMLDIGSDSTKQDVEKAMEGHIINQTLLMGLYGRQ